MADKTEYRFLGGSGLKVSNICLGTLTFGNWALFPGQCDEAASHAILDRYVELGGNFIDTADIYAEGRSEETIGTWLEKQQREKFVVATKVRFNTSKDINSVGLSRHHIMQSIDDSLRRLRTAYVDLYQIHAWDEAVPIEETLSALNDLVLAGKVRYLGASNVTGWQLQKIVELSKSMGLNKWISLQVEYNLLCRGIEWELTDVCRREGIGIIPWSPLKGGLLTGKFKREDDAPEGSRIAHTTKKGIDMEAAPNFERIKKDDKTWKIIDVAKNTAEAHGRFRRAS
ncbi:1-deoxyxylulose-5-phosphate synthase YajO-like [Branchiostoma floridae]|uniref:1-deoxyxylulose-5-phosphate synthase YajO-like n=1 Tax=Branchiostoma floridae TaxID=7739 RepID=A0A9J7HIA5_BRAFL|nr:1-deoxyxylulose-5-phosphate synthase YajO-like [Branchiostoma floridae]